MKLKLVRQPTEQCKPCAFSEQFSKMPRKEVILLDFTKVKHFFELCKKMKNYLNLKLKIYIFKVLKFYIRK